MTIDVAQMMDVEALTPDRLSMANIHPRTLLATDYLNHFNEVIMLLEMLPQMPECAEDVLDWQPCSYQCHFEASGFKDRDLAIRAYELAPAETRCPFDAAVAAIDGRIIEVQDLIRDADGDDPALHEQVMLLVTTELKPLVARVSAIVNGLDDEAVPGDPQHGPTAQMAVDELFG